ncbi:MAG: VOC family protein [Armatimonadetes bacterium]|nr:VOC family protein [Anaerolineae bacterium]
MQKILGLGGVFFRAKDPDMLKKWYEQHFGINADGGAELWRQEAGITIFSPFPADTDYFGRSDQMFMFNFRVKDIDATLEYLRAAGVKIDDQRMEEYYGRFAWVYDPEDNKIELWQEIEVNQEKS